MRNRLENEAPKKKASRLHFLSILVDFGPFLGGQKRLPIIFFMDRILTNFRTRKKGRKKANFKIHLLPRPYFLEIGGTCPAGGGGGEVQDLRVLNIITILINV